jgi:CO/xanthine dehydrogenase Mo-binding subunit
VLEQSETDPALGRFINRNYCGYLVPTNADIPELDVAFVGEFDEEAGLLGAKGLGELTAGSAPRPLPMPSTTPSASVFETCLLPSKSC